MFSARNFSPESSKPSVCVFVNPRKAICHLTQTTLVKDILVDILADSFPPPYWINGTLFLRHIEVFRYIQMKPPADESRVFLTIIR